LVSLGVWVRGSEAEFALAAGLGPEGVWIVRRRSLGGGMGEEILLTKEVGVAVAVRVAVRGELGCAADPQGRPRVARFWGGCGAW
jgi:hypothetical protein